jgi:Tfp pilus assembly protein PilO
VNRLQSLKLEGLKRPPILISLVAVFVLLLVWWFGWMTPEKAKLSTVNGQQQTLTTQLQTLQLQLQTDQHDSAIVAHDAKYLALFAQAVPSSAVAAPLTTQLYNLSRLTHVTLPNLTDDSTSAPAPGATIGSVPISMTVKGSHEACLAFLSGIYKLPRLITISTIAPSEQSSGPISNILADPGAPFVMSISASAYFFTTTIPAA